MQGRELSRRESFSTLKRGGSGSGPGLAAAPGGRVPSGQPRGGRVSRIFHTIKVTLLCGLVTIVVLRGSIGIGRSGGSGDGADDQNLVEETNRILAEIRSDNGTTRSVDDPSEPRADPTAPYSLGPKIEDWDGQRRGWFQRNPGSGKPRILLVSGSPPAPCENPIGDHYLLKAVKNKIDYCRIHGIELFHNTAQLDSQLSGYWSKLPLIRVAMVSHPEAEWIWWMDSDAFFTDMAFEVPVSRYDNHNLVIHGYPDLLDQKSWIALNTGSFLIRNCRWSLDLLDAWAPMGPKGRVRDEAGRTVTAYLTGRPAFEADDQSALIYLLVSKKEVWMERVYVESSYLLHGYWVGLVERYEEMLEKKGEERWPFVTHFVGCKPCGASRDYPLDLCLSGMEKAFNFADNQVLEVYGFRHRGLQSPKVGRIRKETTDPLKSVQHFDLRRRVRGRDGESQR